MRELQEKIVAQMGVHPNMTEEQAREEVQRRVQFLCDYAKTTGTRGFVLGISGGIDSTLAGRLCQQTMMVLVCMLINVLYTL